VTGSLNASLAQWLVGSGRVAAPYVASQGTRLGRTGRVHVSQAEDGSIWVAGETFTLVEGFVELG
jgi:predicted PhzF superfamily epimerase YddE/YHI9